MLNPRKLIAKYRQKFIVPFTILLVIIGLINLYFVFEITPQPNDECIWQPKSINKDSVIFIFDQVKFEGVTWNAGIRDGDRLVAIEGEKIENLIRATMLLDGIKQGDSAVYSIERDGRLFDTKVEIKRLVFFAGLAFALLAFIWLIVGFVVIVAKPNGFTQILFYRIGALFILFSTFNLIVINFGNNPIYNVTWLLVATDITWSFGAVYLPFLVVHFFWVFPRICKIAERRWTTKILYITPTVLFLISILLRIFLAYPGRINQNVFFQMYINILLILLGLAMLVGFVSLIRNYLKLTDKQERIAIFVIILGFTLGIAAIIYSATLANVITDNIFNSPIYFTPIILIAVIPVSFGYSIFRYSLMDVSDVLKNTIIYGAATITVAGIYFAIIYFLGQTISRVIGTEYQGILAGIIFIVFAIVFQSTKDKFQDLLTQKFYPEQFAYQKVLIKFSNDVATIVGLDNILDSTRKTFVEALKLNRFGIMIKKENSNIYEIKRSLGLNSFDFNIIDYNDKIKKYIDEKNLLRQLPVIDKADFESIFTDDYEFLSNTGVYTIIPLVIKSKITGLLLFGLKYSGSQFAGKDLELLVAAANQTAVSIENARLYESEAKKIKMEIDLDNARKIQESLLPRSIPIINRLNIAGIMIPAMHVGGDYYDLIKISDSQIFAIIGDVSGKGLSASFYMSKLQTMMQLYCNENYTPREILEQINKRIYNEIEKNWFITLTIALFDTEAMNVKICRAGHTPTIRIQSNNIDFIQPMGIGIGLEKGDVFNSSIEEKKYEIHSGDSFVLFSDGINEAMNNKEELFGMSNFESVLIQHSTENPTKIIDAVLRSLDKFRGDAERNDDITMVIITVK